MIIDAHTHLFPEEVRKNRRPFCRRDEGFRLIYGNEKARMASPADLLQSMGRDGVDCSVVCGFPWKDSGLCREGNDFLMDCSRQYPGRLIPFACLPLGSLRRAQKELERCLSGGIKGIGELAFYSRGFSPRDLRRLSTLVKPLSGLRLPLLLHANEPVGHDYPGKSLQTLLPIYQFLQLIPGVEVILAHWGGGLFLYELMPEVARAARRVFYDTAASPFLYRPQIYSLAVRITGPDRILFGSDYPLISPGRYFREMGKARLPLTIQKKIKGLNAQHLLFRR
jgi:predicted TIM-barrel fold metal-dependent hydrolase